jgi:hypothetical protein
VSHVDSSGLDVVGAGISAEIAFLFGGESSLMVVEDDKGNVGLAFTGGINAGPRIAIGAPPSPQMLSLPKMDTKFDLNGFQQIHKFTLALVTIDVYDDGCYKGYGGDFSFGLGYAQGVIGTGVLPLGNHEDGTGIFSQDPVMGLIRYYLKMIRGGV